MPTDDQPPTISLRRWSDHDGPLLERLLGDPVMTEHLGGPKTPEQLRRRHARYCTMDDATGRMFVIVAGPATESAGSIGYWERKWRGETIWETGWSVLPEFQGQGIAIRAITAVIDMLHAADTCRSVHAFPSVDNAPSNAICRKTGFTLLDEVDFEYPPGHIMRCSDWSLDFRDALANDQATR